MPPSDADYYAILQVHPAAGVDQIRAAYLRQIGRWHPDRNTSEEATRRTAQINAAWEVLQDPTRRAAYDRQRGRSGVKHTEPVFRRRAEGASQSRPQAVDRAAAERARRGAEASAREARARKQREAEYERRRAASEHLWHPPDERGFGWSDREVKVGHWYSNKPGAERLIEFRGKFGDI
jgi:curved DNA-binding protein CbpA